MTNKVSETIVILSKAGQFASIGLIAAANGAVCRYDPRCNPPNFYQFTQTPEAAQEIFRENVKLSIDRGWDVIYSGPRLQG